MKDMKYNPSDKAKKMGIKGAKISGPEGNPAVIAEAKKKTIGIIPGDGETIAPRADRAMPKRASGGAVMSPAAANSPMACAAGRKT